MNKLALTYDDGPNPWSTPALLDVLARHNVIATFFMLGMFAQQNPDLVHEVKMRGHTVGNHTNTHPNLLQLTPGEIKEEILFSETEIGAPSSSLFRPPYGWGNAETKSIVKSLGLQWVHWDIDGFDWCLTRPEEIEAVVGLQINAGGGGIVLLHDGDYTNMGSKRSATIEATDRVIAKYKSEGFEFVSVSEMPLPGIPRKDSLR